MGCSFCRNIEGEEREGENSKRKEKKRKGGHHQIAKYRKPIVRCANKACLCLRGLPQTFYD